MCDTFVATGSVTSTGNMIFGKNSDREPNEAQSMERVFRRTGSADSHRRLTFIDIPDGDGSEVLLSRPFQMFGAEMGVNEHGLVIGNEAVFTKIPMARKNDGLTGMDMLRLALERCRSTDEAVHFMAELLDRYGQDACGGYQDRGMFYHNSFLVADGVSARVFETAGRFWVSKPVEGYYAISNGLTIGEDFDLSSRDIADRCAAEGYRGRSAPMDFARIFSDRFYTKLSRCTIRRELSTAAIGRAGKGFSVADAFAVLRSHAPGKVDDPSRMGMGSVCLHAAGLFTPSQTTGSMVVEAGAPMNPGDARLRRVFATGTSSPCLSVFKPVSLPGTWLQGDGARKVEGANKSPEWQIPGASEDDSLWWKHEGLHRRVLAAYSTLAPLIQEEQHAFEEKYLLASAGIACGEEAMDRLSREAFQEHSRLLDRWRLRVREKLGSVPSVFRPLYRNFWKRQNEVLSRAL